MRALIVDDEPQIVRAVTAGMGTTGWEVRGAGNGETALTMLATDAFDVVLLDLGLPGIDGIEVARRARAFTSVPIIVLSVRDAEADKVAALDAGADDYVTKPFGFDELMARVRAVLRRRPETGTAASVLRSGPVELDLVKRAVTRDGDPVHLTPTQYDLLVQFMRHPGRLLTHQFLRDKVWGGGGSEESLRVHIAQLRRKLEDAPSQPVLLLTEPGLGYRWTDE